MDEDDFDDEELDLEDEEESEDDESENEDSEDEDQGEDSETSKDGEKKQSSFQMNLKQAKEKREKNQLNDLQKKVMTLWDGNRWYWPHFTLQEKSFLWRMKRKKKYDTQIAAIENLMKSRQEAYKSTYQGIVSTIGPFVLIGALIIFLIIAVIVIIATIFPWLFPDDDLSNGGGGGKSMNSAFGVKGDKFYGCRAIYKDDALAQNGLVEQYTSVVSDSITAIETVKITKTDTKGTEDVADDTTYDITLNVTFTLPADDFNFSEMDLTQFATDYPELYKVVYDIAKFVASEDSGITIADGTEIREVLNLITYFGFNEELIGTEISGEIDNVMEIILDSLKTNNYIQVVQPEGDTLTVDDLKTDIETALRTALNIDANKVRLDKVFIKDFIFETDESYCEGIEEREYIAFIYMAKSSVEFNYVSYMVNAEQDVEVALVLTNGGNRIGLSESEGENWGSNEEDTSLTKIVSSSDSLSETLSVYQNIDTNNLSLLQNGESLYKALKLINEKGINVDKYFEQTTDENGMSYYTAKISDSDMVLRFESTGKFAFNDEASYE